MGALLLVSLNEWKPVYSRLSIQTIHTAQSCSGYMSTHTISPLADLLGFMQQFNSLVPPALVYVEQAELHHTVGHQVVVELDLFFAEYMQKGG